MMMAGVLNMGVFLTKMGAGRFNGGAGTTLTISTSGIADCVGSATDDDDVEDLDDKVEMVVMGVLSEEQMEQVELDTV